MNEHLFYTPTLTKFCSGFYHDFEDDLMRLIHESPLRDGVNPTVGKEIGRILMFFVSLTGAKRMLDLGTCVGVSAILLARAGGKDAYITTIDHRADLIEEAKVNFLHYGVADRIEAVAGDVKDVVPTLKGPFDLIVQDSAKKLYKELLPYLVDLLAPGGLLITDDVLFSEVTFPAHIKGMNTAVAEFNADVRAHPLLESIFIPVGDGLIVSRKKQPEGA